MIKNCSNTNFYPFWSGEYFKGISMVNNNEKLDYQYLSCYGFDFSHSYFKNLVLQNSNLTNANFSNSTFDLLNIIDSKIKNVLFDNIKIVAYSSSKKIRGEGNFSLTFCDISQGLLFPRKLNDILKGTDSGIVNDGIDYLIIDTPYSNNLSDLNIQSLKGIFKYIIEQGHGVDIILSSFKFPNKLLVVPKNAKNQKSIKDQFEEFIYEIENEVKSEQKV